MKHGTVYSNTQTITVYDTVKLSVYSGYEGNLTQEICSDVDGAFQPVQFKIDTASDKTTNLNFNIYKLFIYYLLYLFH